MWFLKSDTFKSKFKDYPLVYISWGKRNFEVQPSFKRLLEILEVDVDSLKEITQPTQFERIILPDRSFSHIERGFTNEYRETINSVRDFALKSRKSTSAKKVYYFYGRGNSVGEERLASYFKSKGYEIIRPETLSLDEQLNILINCESFASTAGSCSHNSVFLRDGTETIFIPRTANAFTGYQQTLDQVHPVKSNFIDSTMSVFNMRHDFYCYIISEQLRQFFGDEFDDCEEDNCRAFLDYVKIAIEKKGRSINTRHAKDYGKAFTDFMIQLKQREDLIATYNMPPHWEEFRPTLTYQTHIHSRGWGDGWKGEGQTSNDIEQKLDIQAIKINFPNHKVYYSVYYNEKEGWTEEVSTGDVAGITGKHKSIFGIRIRLDEAGAKNFNLLYRVHKFDDTWTDWAKNGENLYSYGQKINAVQVKLEFKS